MAGEVALAFVVLAGAALLLRAHPVVRDELALRHGRFPRRTYARKSNVRFVCCQLPFISFGATA